MPLQLAFTGFLSPPIVRTQRFASAILAALTLACSVPGLAESSPPKGVDAEVVALVQELRDQPEAKKLGCTPCAVASREAHTSETPEDARRSEIYDRLHALGSAAVPVLARRLESSLRGSDRDLTSTILWILSGLSGPWTSRAGSQHNQNDISAALPALILALDDPTGQQSAAGIVGSIGPKAAETVPRLLALLDDGNAGLRWGACSGLKGIEPLPALRQELSDPNPDKQRFAQRAIASIETKCIGPDLMSPLDELARTADLVCKATVIADRSATDDSFKPIDGFEVREAELRVVSTLKGGPLNVIRFRYYGPAHNLLASTPFSLLRAADRYLTHIAEAERYPFSTGRTYLLVATQIAGETYREVAAFLPSSSHAALYVGPPRPHFVMMRPGVLLAADAKPHRGTTLTEAAWSELIAVLKSPREDDVLEAIDRLDELSGGPAWSKGVPPIGDFGLGDIKRSRALSAIAPLVRAKSSHIATTAVTVFGRDSPYFYDQDVPFWFVGIGNGHITGLGARKRPANPMVADIGAKELLQVATDGTTPELRALAIRALGRSPHAYPAAIVAVWARDRSAEVRWAAVLASADVPDHEPIMTASTDGSPALRRTTAWAVGFAQDPRLLPLLDRLLHDPAADVRSAAAMSLLSYPVYQAAPVMKANLTSDFRPLFVNALASADPQPYLAMLAEVIEQQGTELPYWKQPTGWNYGGTIPAGDSWHILFDFVRSRPADELTSGKLDSSLNALERLHWFGSGEPTELYALYLSRGLVSRAKQFREITRKSASFDMDVFFDRADQNPATYVR
jgi:HEAT repeat protein